MHILYEILNQHKILFIRCADKLLLLPRWSRNHFQLYWNKKLCTCTGTTRRVLSLV